MLGWSWTKAARVVDDALKDAKVDGCVAVVGRPELAKALALKGRPVVALAASARSARSLRKAATAARAADGALPIGDGAVAAVVAAAGDALAEWARAVKTGGAIVLVADEPAEEGTRRALCAGLVDLEQRTAGRLVVTSGRVVRLG